MEKPGKCFLSGSCLQRRLSFITLGAVAVVFFLLPLFMAGCGTKIDYAEQIKDGRYNDVELGSDSASQIIGKLGKPTKQETLSNGAIHLTYDDITYGINGHTKRLGVIVSYSKTKKLLGVNVGMSFNEAKSILGSPTAEQPGANTSDINRWVIEYRYGQNALVLGGPSRNGPITIIMFMNLNRN